MFVHCGTFVILLLKLGVRIMWMRKRGELNWFYCPTLHQCTLGQGVNREGFNFKLAMVKPCSLTPPEQVSTLKKFWSWSSDPTITSDPLHSLWERPKIENLNFVFAMVKMHSKEPLRNYWNVETKIGHDLQAPCLKWLFLVKNGNFFTFGCCWVSKTLQIFN